MCSANHRLAWLSKLLVEAEHVTPHHLEKVGGCTVALVRVCSEQGVHPALRPHREQTTLFGLARYPGFRSL